MTREEAKKNLVAYMYYAFDDLPEDVGRAIDMAIKALEGKDTNVPTKWIPVSERLPEQGESVICQCRANIIKVLKLDAYFDWYQDANHCYMNGFVIAWMPLPEPYKAESEETDANSN